MRYAVHPARRPGQGEQPLLILLPGLNMHHDEFAAHGFVAAAQTTAESLEILTIEPALDLYFDGAVAAAISPIIRERQRRGAARIWLAGISLGAFGALLTASADPAAIEGLILLAPFLGTPGLIAEVERAGGLAAWAPGPIAANDGERRILAWLRQYASEERDRPILRLAYGRDDRFAAASRLLAACLPAAAVSIADGGHDWRTWMALWDRILATRPFAAPPETRA